MNTISWTEYREKLSAMPVFTDGYNRDYEEDSGLYLMGTTTFNPITDEKYYWIKSGKSTNIHNRLRSYRTDNPAFFLIDVEIFDKTNLSQIERYCHLCLMEKAIAKSSICDEWFLVDKQTYLEICEKKFNWFWTVR